MPVIWMQHLTVDGLRVLWSHHQLGGTRTVLKADLEAGLNTMMTKRNIQSMIAVREHFT